MSERQLALEWEVEWQRRQNAFPEGLTLAVIPEELLFKLRFKFKFKLGSESPAVSDR